jgi:hypothetical protein
MKRALLLILVPFLTVPLFSQKIDSIYFHLYTDSLKKGQHNYISVDGKLSDGRWEPLTSKEIEFSSSAGKFDGNDLILPADSKEEKVNVKVVLKSNPEIWKEVVIWIKTIPDPDHLPTLNDLPLSPPSKTKKKKKG